MDWTQGVMTMVACVSGVLWIYNTSFVKITQTLGFTLSLGVMISVTYLLWRTHLVSDQKLAFTLGGSIAMMVFLMHKFSNTGMTVFMVLMVSVVSTEVLSTMTMQPWLRYFIVGVISGVLGLLKTCCFKSVLPVMMSFNVSFTLVYSILYAVHGIDAWGSMDPGFWLVAVLFFARLLYIHSLIPAIKRVYDRKQEVCEQYEQIDNNGIV